MKTRRMTALIAAMAFLGTAALYGQAKRDLTAKDIENWPRTGMVEVSPDGKYVAYNFGNYDTGMNAWIKSTDSRWERKFTDSKLSGPYFSKDSKTALFPKADTLLLITLGTDRQREITGVTRHELKEIGGKQKLLYMQEELLVIEELSGSGRRQYDGVQEYLFVEDGGRLLLKKADRLVSIDLKSWAEATLYDGAVNTITPNAGGNTIAFTTGDSITTAYHILRDGNLISVGADKITVTPGNLSVAGINTLSSDGRLLFVSLEEKLQKPAEDAVMVDVWHYADWKSQDNQLKALNGSVSYLGLFDIRTGVARRLQRDGERVEQQRDSTLLIYNEIDKSLVQRNFITGKDHTLPLPGGELTRDGKYYIYSHYTKDSLMLYSHEMATGRTLPLMKLTPRTQPYWHMALTPLDWIDDHTRLYCDFYDIWTVDITGRTEPCCLTGGYGERNRISLRPFYGKDSPKGIPYPFYVGAFDYRTAEYGFYVIDRKGAEPRRQTMGPWGFGMNNFFEGKAYSPRPVGKNTWLVSRESTAESENFFLTKDFKTFTPVTENYPEKDFNWITAELIPFETLEGKPSQAVLYKPENFDPSKKYPLIITYYEKYALRINNFPVPDISTSTICIPWEVSRGYMVMTVDIYYTDGKVGQSALSAVEGAVNTIGQRPYIDTERIGLIGQSFGAVQTNYIVSHSTRYRCAISSSGYGNMIAAYTIPNRHGALPMDFYELGQPRMGGTLWEKKEEYLDASSPILDADRIKTPMLIMANKGDGVVDFAGGVALFRSLQRLGQKVWLLQYDNEGHMIGGLNACRDRFIRYDQFFDHYLMDKPMPEWMATGIPAKYKGVKDGLSLTNGDK